MKKTFTLLALLSFLYSGAQTPANSPLIQTVYEEQAPKPLPKKSNWYGWFDWYQVLENDSVELKRFRATLFPDSTMLITSIDSLGNKHLQSVHDHSIGMINDPRSSYFYDAPFQTTKFNTYTVDSAAINYMYNRWNPDTSIHDTLLFQFYPASAMFSFVNSIRFSLPYNYQKNEGNMATYRYYRVLTADDTNTSAFKFLTVPVAMNVNWSNNGNNRFGLTVSFIPGQKNYSQTAPFDTLDAGDWNPAARFNQFEYELIHDYDIITESSLSDPNGLKVSNNGLTVHTPIRYNMAGSLNGYYYKDTWVNEKQVEYLRFPRLIWHGTCYSCTTSIHKVIDPGHRMGEVYPNPAKGSFSIDLELAGTEKVSWVISDLSGKVIKEVSPEYYNKGLNSLHVDADGIAGGLYVMTIRVGTFSTGKKLLIVPSE